MDCVNQQRLLAQALRDCAPPNPLATALRMASAENDWNILGRLRATGGSEEDAEEESGYGGEYEDAPPPPLNSNREDLSLAPNKISKSPSPLTPDSTGNNRKDKPATEWHVPLPPSTNAEPGTKPTARIEAYPSNVKPAVILTHLAANEPMAEVLEFPT